MSEEFPVSLSVDSNVKIICLKGDKILRESTIHNKATILMVEGLLRFLLGDFNPTEYVEGEESVTHKEAEEYIPVELRFGNVGVDIKTEEGREDYPTLLRVSLGKMKTPTFDDYRLQEEIHYTDFVLGIRSNRRNRYIRRLDEKSVRLGFETATITSFEDPNNSMGLLLRTFLPAGKLTGYLDVNESTDVERRIPFIQKYVEGSGYNGWAYWNGLEYETMITEMGLYSNSGGLLARVLFDGKVLVNEDGSHEYEIDGASNNPIVQTDSTALVIEWKIGIVSIGDNDHIITGSDLRNLGTNVSEEVVQS